MSGHRGNNFDWQKEQQALAREAERQRKIEERARILAEKDRQRRHVERRQAQITKKNQDIEATVTHLTNILRNSLTRSARIHLETLKKKTAAPEPNLGELATPIPKPVWKDFVPEPPGLLSRMFGGETRYADRIAYAEEEFEQAQREHEKKETKRQQQVIAACREHKKQVEQAEAATKSYNQDLADLARGLQQRQQAAVENYLQRVLSAMPLPHGFTRDVEIAFSPRAEQVVVRFELPPREVVPKLASYKYLTTKDEERPVPRNAKEIAALYRSVVSQVALLCVRDLFGSDPALQSVGFNGHVHAINPATGVREYPCIISLSVDREQFPKDQNLREVDPDACVRHLNAIVSNHPYDLEPIEPILDFDLSKFSFVEGFDAVSTLDSRPDLMHMSATNFEHLVRQIFEAQGAEGWTTQQSNDDGVDAVIARRTPLFGGLSIVQAKRYSKVVGINHVRELAGAMEEKKAGWGILVTTSWFTAKCWEKVREHGRMELIDGERLIYLIKENLGKDVLIGIPNRPRPKQGD